LIEALKEQEHFHVFHLLMQFGAAWLAGGLPLHERLLRSNVYQASSRNRS
jgi:hypothetical protein